jgi:AraC-like DNA-binding protein
MQAEGASASSAAFAVGYESVPQFTREYGRMFGLPPVRDMEAAKGRAFAAVYTGWADLKGEQANALCLPDARR